MLLNDNLLMVKPEGSESKLKLWQRLGALAAFCLLVVLASTTMARAQCMQGTTEFTLCAAPLSPQAIVPGGTSSTSLTIGSVNGFSGTVTLGCAVTPTQTVTDAPVCTLTPSSVTVSSSSPATATATITTQTATTTGGYDVTITGTGPTTTYTTPSLGLTLLAQCTQGTSEFTLCPATLSPPAIVPGGTSSTSLTIGSVNGFSEAVNLGCTVTASQTVTDAPVCTVSPTSVTPPATATATITSQRGTTTVGYDVTVTGTGSTTTYTTPPLGLTVLAVIPQFTVAIQTAMSPNSVPAGNAAQGVISVNPVNGYSTPKGGITLYCSSITPLVTIPPVCSFSPNGSGLQLVDSPESVTLTIKTAGTTVIGAAPHPRSFYALWLSIPMLGFVAVGAAMGGKRSGKALAVLFIFLLCGCCLLLPACVNQLSNGAVGTPNGITPANTYTFTIVGVDSDGVGSSNTGTSTGPTMTLTVTAPPKT